MNLILHAGKYFISRRNVFLALSSIVILSACQKESKPNPSPAFESTSREAQSITSLASKIDTGGLVAWYSFDSGSLRDISSYHNKVIFNNAQPTTDRNGSANNAYYFDGASSYMEIKNSPSLSPDKEITLFAIVRFDDFYEGKCHGNRILFKGYDDFSSGAYYLGSSDGYYTGQQNCSQPVDKAHQSFETKFATTGVGDTASFVQTGHWYHLVYTFGKGTTKFYVDGKLVNSQSQRLFTASNNDNLYIGVMNKYNTQYPYWFHGSVDQVAIFNRALNETQVSKLSAY